MQKLKLRTKIIVGFVVIFLFAIVLGVYSLICFGQISDLFGQQLFIEEANTSALQVTSAHHEWLEKLSYSVYTGAEFNGSTDPATCALGKWKQTDFIQKNADPTILQLLASLETPHDYIHQHAAGIAQLARSGNAAEAESAFEKEILPRAREVILALNKIGERYSTLTDEKAASITAMQNSMQTVVIILLILTVLLSVSLAIMITKSIMKPLREINSAADKLILGDLDISVSYDVKDEIGAIVGSMKKVTMGMQDQSNIMERLSQGDWTVTVTPRSDKDTMMLASKRMVESMNDMFRDIAKSCGQVSGGARQIADGAHSLAQGSTEQASAVEELSVSIAEVAHKTSGNAALAENAATLAGTIKQKAETGSDQMGKMMQAVAEINEASESISRVIKVIDDIAFQTNILALNAAVEAARAGQHGRGFAVVAEEVRNLAAKSSEAAKNTGSLIANSMAKAALGAKIAQETSGSLTEIVSGINESSAIVVEIARFSEEQSHAIENINQGVEQVAQVVQQNSATAEESASASQEMSTQAETLQELISRVKLREVGRTRLGGGDRPPAMAASAGDSFLGTGFGKY